MKSVIYRENSLLGTSGSDTSSIISSNIWADCPFLDFKQTGNCYYIDNDFRFIEDDVTITSVVERHYDDTWYDVFGDDGTADGTVTKVAGSRTGELLLTVVESADQTAIASELLPFKIAPALGKLWFEARVKTSTVAASDQNIFVGLAGAQTLATAVPIATGTTLDDMNIVGFHKPEADETTFDTRYTADTVTSVKVQDGLGTLAADTYIKLGMKFDPDNGNELSFFVNGVKQTGTKTIPSAAGTDFPNDVNLGVCVAVLSGSANDTTVTVDWIKCYQDRLGA